MPREESFTRIDFVRNAIEEVQPVAVVMLGEFPGRAMVTVERIAQNLNDGTRYGLADDDGNRLQDQLTAPDGPATYCTTLPIRALMKVMRSAGVPSDISDAPGTFCCNHLIRDTASRCHSRTGHPSRLDPSPRFALRSQPGRKPGHAQHVGRDVGSGCEGGYRSSTLQRERYFRSPGVEASALIFSSRP